MSVKIGPIFMFFNVVYKIGNFSLFKPSQQQPR